MADANTGGLSYLDITDPQGALQNALIQRRMAIAQALLQQGLEPMGGTQMAGQVAIRNSPVQGLAKALQTYAGVSGLNNATQQAGSLLQNRLQQQQGVAQQELAGQQQAPQQAALAAQPPGAGPTNQAAQIGNTLAQQTPGPFSGMSPTDLVALKVQNPGKYQEMINAWNTQQQSLTPEAVRLARAAGQDPQAAAGATLFKQNYVPPVGYSPGTAYGQPGGAGPTGYLPQPPQGGTLPGLADLSRGGVGPTPGFNPTAAGTAGTVAGAGAAATAPYDTVQVFDPTTQTMRTVPKSMVTGGGGAPRPQPQPMPNAQPGAPLPPQTPGLQSAPALGQPEQVGAMQQRWAAQQGANSEAQNMVSYLQEIKRIAPQAATGPFTERLQYVNQLLSTIPGAQQATDAVTANALLDKYGSQIVARLGQGGLGTDAARGILQQAYPGAHMNLPAINDAIDNLVGAQRQTQAKTALLQSYANRRDAVGYANAETAFNSAADPRVFQLRDMTPQQQAQYVGSLNPQVAAQLLAAKKKLQALQAY